MRDRALRTVGLLAAAAGILAVAPRHARSGAARLSPSSARSCPTARRQRVKLGLNKSVVIDLPADAYDILVANPAVADAVTRTARRIYLFGKCGRRDQHLRLRPERRADRQPRSRVERDVAGLEDYLKRFIPTSDITVELLNDNVVLTGTVDTPLDAKRAVDLATIFVTGGEATTGQYSQTAAGGSMRRRRRHRQSRPGRAASARSSTCCRSSATTR